MGAKSGKGLFDATYADRRKTCADCGEEKPWTEFYRARGKHGHSDHPMGRCVRCYCKVQRDRHQRRYPVDPAYREKIHRNGRDSRLRRMYGLSESDYQRMLAAQKGRCAICGNTKNGTTNRRPRMLAVDHCHVTGKVRMLLCCACNTFVGRIESNPSFLAKALAYIERHKAPATE